MWDTVRFQTPPLGVGHRSSSNATAGCETPFVFKRHRCHRWVWDTVRFQTPLLVVEHRTYRATMCRLLLTLPWPTWMRCFFHSWLRLMTANSWLVVLYKRHRPTNDNAICLLYTSGVPCTSLDGLGISISYKIENWRTRGVSQWISICFELSSGNSNQNAENPGPRNVSECLDLFRISSGNSNQNT